MKTPRESPMNSRPSTAASITSTTAQSTTSSTPKNFIALNKSRIKQIKRTQDSPTPVKQSTPGILPKYIIDRKLDLALKLQMAADAKLDTTPHGMKLMPETERIKTLDFLRESLHDLEHELGSLSIVSDTQRILRQRQALETRVEECLEGIKVFEKKLVYENI